MPASDAGRARRMFARKNAEHGGNAPPEARLVPGMLGAVLAPLSLFWLAFTTYKSVNSAVPIIASVPFGAGVFFIFTSAWTVCGRPQQAFRQADGARQYLVILYRGRRRSWRATASCGGGTQRRRAVPRGADGAQLLRRRVPAIRGPNVRHAGHRRSDGAPRRAMRAHGAVTVSAWLRGWYTGSLTSRMFRFVFYRWGPRLRERSRFAS
jgi:hypothetical protein